MKILVIGGTGTIGKTIVAHFLIGNEVIVAGRTADDYKVEIADSKSIKKLFKKENFNYSFINFCKTCLS